jgi:hypothetical protein
MKRMASLGVALFVSIVVTSCNLNPELPANSNSATTQGGPVTLCGNELKTQEAGQPTPKVPINQPVVPPPTAPGGGGGSC